MKLLIGQMCDGWAVQDEDGKTIARWDHNDEDLGVDALKALIEYLGHDAEIEEWY